MKNFIQSKVNFRKGVHPDFKKIIKDMRQAFLELKSRVDAAEKSHTPFDVVVSQYYQLITDVQDRLLLETNQIADSFNDEEHLIHKDFLRDQLGPLFWQAPLHERALLKPLGYAGDYEMMNMLYDEHPFHGPSYYFKLIQAASCRCISGRLSAARIPYFLERFESLAKLKKGKVPLFILDLASGPCREIVEWMKKSPLSAQAEFYLVDQDPQAITFSQKVIEELKTKTDHALKAHFYTVRITDLFTSSLVSEWPKFDLIYSAGLFDYLDDDLFKMAISGLGELLTEGGELLLGNISPDDYSKIVKWYLDDWPLIYRTKEELLSLAEVFPGPKKVSIEAESTGVNLFLRIRKD